MSEENAQEKEDANVTTKQTASKPQQEVPKTASAGIFGITKETKSSNNVPIPPVTKMETPNAMYPTGYAFPIAKLVNVVCNPELELKSGEKVPVIQFIFVDKEKRQHTHTEWSVDSSDAKFTEKAEGLNVRIKHIFTVCFGGFPEAGIGTSATNYTEYFNMIADAFNSIVKDGKKVYASNDYFLKLVFYKENLGFPLGPNFLQKVEPSNPVCKQLNINPKYDNIEPQKSSSSIPGISGGSSPVDMPDFEKDFN